MLKNKDISDLTAEIIKYFLVSPISAAYRITSKGKENLPKGRAILAANHTTYLDPSYLISAVNPRKPIKFIAMPKKGFNLLYKITNQITLTSPHKLKEAITFLEQERYVGYFPEGRLSKTGELNEFKTGGASLALRTNSPMVPIYIQGGYDQGKTIPSFLRRIEVKIGKPIYPQDKTKIELTDLLKVRMEELSEER